MTSNATLVHKSNNANLVKNQNNPVIPPISKIICCAKLPSKVAITPFHRLSGDNHQTRPPYSPILLGINSENDIPVHIAANSLNVLGICGTFRSVRHLQTSKYQFSGKSKSTIQIHWRSLLTAHCWMNWTLIFSNSLFLITW